jgi:hypothetical protein
LRRTPALRLGAILSKQPAAYVLTDPHRELKENGRPYNVMDGRQPQELAKILGAIDTYKNGWWIFDGGGNRPALDAEMAAQTDLVILPFRDSEEDVEAVTRDMHAYSNAFGVAVCVADEPEGPTGSAAPNRGPHVGVSLARHSDSPLFRELCQGTVGRFAR